MGIIKTGKIQSHGDIVGLTTRIAALEDKYVKALWYAEIGSGTSGTITPPANGTIVLNEFGNDVDAVTSTITTGKKPDFVSAKTAAGDIVTATLAANGAWTISGAPSAYPIALVYVYEIKLVKLDHDSSLYEEEFGQAVNPSNSPIFVGLTLSGLTASLPVVTGSAKELVSQTYANFKTSLSLAQADIAGLTTTSSPTFVGLVVPGISPAANFVLTQSSVAVLTSVGASAVVDTLYLKEGKVGIGTTEPNNSFEINSGTFPQVRVSANATSGGSGIVFKNASNTYSFLLASEYNVSQAFEITPSTAVGGTTFTTPAITVLGSNGNVGIGVSAPGALLHVVGDYPQIRISQTETNSTPKYAMIGATHYTTAEEAVAVLFVGSDGTDNYLKFGGGASQMNANTYVSFFTAATPTTLTGTERMRIISDGKVGIGDSAPGELLDVAGNINATGVLKIDDVQVVSNRVINAAIDDTIEAAFTALYPNASAVLAALRDATQTHGLIAPS